MKRAVSSLTPVRQEIGSDERAGALALQIAFQIAATAPRQGGSHASRHTALQRVLRLLLEAVDANIVACYVASDGALARRVALASSGVPMARSRLAAARRAAHELLVSEHADLRAPEDGPSGSSPRCADSMLALPLEASGRQVALVVAWPADSAAEREQVALLKRLAPTLALAVTHLLARPTRHPAKPPAVPPGPGGQTAHNSDAIRRGVLRTPPASTLGFGPPHADFIAKLSHELRTPLNTLCGFLEIVLDERVGTLTDRQREFLGYARSSAAQLIALIENLLAERS